MVLVWNVSKDRATAESLIGQTGKRVTLCSLNVLNQVESRSLTHCLWTFLGCNQYWAGGFMSFVGYYVQELQKAQPAVVLVIKRLRRRGQF